MRKHRRLTALILALALLIGVAGSAVAQDDQEEYWIKSGRSALYNTLYGNGGTTLSAAERSAFFKQHAVEMGHCEYYPYGAFTIYDDGTFTGEAGYYEGDTYICSAFVGQFTNVVRLTPYVYALQTNDIDFYQQDFPEAMQYTMILTIPGAQVGMYGSLNYEIQRIAGYLGVNANSPLPCYFITAFDSAPVWYSDKTSTSSSSGNTWYPDNSGSNTGNTTKEIYGLAIQKLATRTGPGTSYSEGGTYNVKDQYIKILSRAWDKPNGIWWVKCEIPYHGEIRVLWTGWKRFDHSVTNLEDIPIDPNY